MNHQKGEQFSRAETAKSALYHRFNEHGASTTVIQLVHLSAFQIQYPLIFIDGLQLRHSFSAPKQMDVKMPLKNRGGVLEDVLGLEDVLEDTF